MMAQYWICRLVKCLVAVNELLQIRIHELEHDRQVVEVVDVGGRQQVVEVNNILKFEHPQYFDLTQQSLGIGEVVKDVYDLLDCHRVLALSVLCQVYVTVATTA